MFQFGFSYVGLAYLLMLFIPNIIWTKNQPVDYGQYVKQENRLLQLFEKIGEVLVCCVVLIFKDFNVRFDSAWCVWLILSFVLMLLYEYYWIRYFKSKKQMSDFYTSVLGIPVAGATLPVCAFFLLGVYGCNAFLMIATIVLGIGHIGIHWQHYKSIAKERKKKMIVFRILGGIFIIVLVLAVIGMTVLMGIRNYHYIQCHIGSEKGIYEGIYVPLEGQEQYIHIVGENTDNPVIIYLHGGPASPDSLATYTFTKHLADEYTIICWDQRGCGRTYYKNKDIDPKNETATFAQAQKDLGALVTYACERFNQDKVIIMGHSYGTILGSEYVLSHPEKVSAYIGIGQFASIEKGDKTAYEDALVIAAEKGDNTAEMTAAYEAYEKDRSVEKLTGFRKFIAPYYKAPRGKNTIMAGLTSPDANLIDFKWQIKPMFFMKEYIDINKQLLDCTFKANLFEGNLSYKMPVAFISGSCDFATPVKCTQEYMDVITAPKKEMYVLEGCSHGPQFDAPEEFAETIKKSLSETK